MDNKMNPIKNGSGQPEGLSYLCVIVKPKEEKHKEVFIYEGIWEGIRGEEANWSLRVKA